VKKILRKKFFVKENQPITYDNIQLIDTGSVPNWLNWMLEKEIPASDIKGIEKILYGSQTSTMNILKKKLTNGVGAFVREGKLDSNMVPKGIIGVAGLTKIPITQQKFPLSNSTSIFVNRRQTLIINLLDQTIIIGEKYKKISEIIEQENGITLPFMKNASSFLQPGWKQIFISEKYSEKIINTLSNDIKFDKNLPTLFDTGSNFTTVNLPGQDIFERLLSFGGGVPQNGFNLFGFNSFIENYNMVIIDYDHDFISLIPKKKLLGTGQSLLLRV
tara:strand:- start:439 stop:1260 length:822 start_codon:yes stop_codon:yes gene_type:complete